MPPSAPAETLVSGRYPPAVRVKTPSPHRSDITMRRPHGRRSRALLALVSLGLIAAEPAPGQGLGISAGANFSSLDDVRSGSVATTFDRSTGYHVGAFLNLGSGRLSVRPGVYYHDLGRYELSDGRDFDLSAIEAALDLRFRILSLPGLRPYGLVAPVLTFGRTDADFEEAVEDLSLTGDVGAGVEISLPGTGLVLMPEIRYGIGVTDYLSDAFEIGGTTVRPSDDESRLSKLMLRLNVAF